MILSSKNRFRKFWNFDPWWPQFWPEPKNDRYDFEMIFRELSFDLDLSKSFYTWSWRALTRQRRWYQNRCSISKIKGFIVENPFCKILEFLPLETSILNWAKKWPKWFRNDFSRAFERCLSFFSTATRSRDHVGGGGRSNDPPAGGEKSRSPAGRALK